jgi:hypothetical protein
MTISHRNNGRKSRDSTLVARKIEGRVSVDAVSTSFPLMVKGEGSGVPDQSPFESNLSG